MTRTPTPGPLDSESVKLLVKGDLLLFQGKVVPFMGVWNTTRGTPGIKHEGGSQLARFYSFIGRPDADGWIPWSGETKGPVDGTGMILDLIMSDDREYLGQKAPRFWHLVSKWRPARSTPQVETLGPAAAFAADVVRDGWQTESIPLGLWVEIDLDTPIQSSFVSGRPARWRPIVTPTTQPDTGGAVEASGSERDGPEVGEDAVAKILAPYLALINSTPDLLSILYDADLMPEQTVTVRGAICVAAVCEAYKAALNPAPVASGGQHSSANDFPPGEVTDEWAERFCEAVNWSPDGQECKAVEGQVRCVSFRDLAKGYILSAIATQPAITSATAPVAETAGEAVEVVSGCARADLYTADLPTGTLLYAAPVPAQDDDKLRIAASALLDACVKDFGDPADFEGDDGSVARSKSGGCAVTFKHMRDLAAALKSTAAQEGGSK